MKAMLARTAVHALARGASFIMHWHYMLEMQKLFLCESNASESTSDPKIKRQAHYDVERKCHAQCRG